MKKSGSILFFSGLLLLVISAVSRGLIGETTAVVGGLAGVGAVLLVAAAFVSRVTIIEILSMRTTKHGLNMGWLILLSFVSIGIANFLAVKWDHKWDLSSDGVNSLSEQSAKIVGGLKEDVKVIFLFRKGEAANDPEQQGKRQIEELMSMYRAKTSKMQLESYNALVRPDLASKYEFKSGTMGIFLEHQGRHMKVDAATEEAMTKALLKLTRDQSNRRTICFAQGHGERELEGNKPEGISFLKSELETVYNIKGFTPFQAGNIPPECTVLAIIGPRQPWLPAEIESFKAFLKKGGRVFFAADPGEHGNVAEMVSLMGVEYHNDYVLDPRARVPGAGTVAALGTVNSRTSDITKGMDSAIELFLLASSIGKIKTAPADYKFDELVKTNEMSRATMELTERPNIVSGGPHTIAMSVAGKYDGATADFAAVVIGDSDFAADQLITQYSNRDFILNSMSYLAKDEDMISIRPKVAKAGTLDLHGANSGIVVFGLLLPVPLLLFIAGGAIWFRRRSA